ncbi:MAG: FG-GAP repeat domain-containing protein, partial [Gemmataceae bacterium]
MFQDCSASLPVPRGETVCSVAFDADGDGHCEFFVSTVEDGNHLWKWTGESFVDCAPPILMHPLTSARVAIAADVNADGQDELILVHRRGTELFQPPSQGRPGWITQDLGTIANALAVFDRRGTGRYSLALLHTTERFRFLELAEEGGFVDRAEALGLTDHRGKQLFVMGWPPHEP